MIHHNLKPMISSIISSVIGDDDSIKRNFTQLTAALGTYWGFADTLEFQSGDTFEVDFLAPTVVATGGDYYITDGDDSNDRGSLALLQSGKYLLGSGVASVTVDGVAITGATSYPLDGKLHTAILTLNANAKIHILGSRFSLAHFYSGIIANPVSTMSGATKKWTLGDGVGNNTEQSTPAGNAITRVNVPDASIEQFTFVDDSWWSDNYMQDPIDMTSSQWDATGSPIRFVNGFTTTSTGVEGLNYSTNKVGNLRLTYDITADDSYWTIKDTATRQGAAPTILNGGSGSIAGELDYVSSTGGLYVRHTTTTNSNLTINKLELNKVLEVAS